LLLNIPTALQSAAWPTLPKSCLQYEGRNAGYALRQVAWIFVVQLPRLVASAFLEFDPLLLYFVDILVFLYVAEEVQFNGVPLYVCLCERVMAPAVIGSFNMIRLTGKKSPDIATIAVTRPLGCLRLPDVATEASSRRPADLPHVYQGQLLG
jgi:hypothetical protein